MHDDYHIPVLLNESIELLINTGLNEHVIVDGTLGGGSYSERICNKLKNNFKLICLDKDLNALEYSKSKLEMYDRNITYVNENFGMLKKILTKLNISSISGLVLDLGLSSFQLTVEDGFSFMRDSDLDMRADKKDTLKAKDILNDYSKEELEKIFTDYGEIGNSGRLASKITEVRKQKNIYTTFDLVDIVKSEYKIDRKNLFDFLAKIFQALRIEVNNELENLKRVLSDSVDFLSPGGRIAVVSYHSLEDRIVKNFMKENSVKESVSKYKPGSASIKKILEILTKKPIVPSRQEIKSNPKARSAKLRAAEKI